jgi:hypothetical protein
MGDLSRKTARHLLTAMTAGVIMSRSRNIGLEVLIERHHATAAPLLNVGGTRILQHVAYTITPAGRAWLDETAAPIIRESTNSGLDIESALRATIMALRSYEFGNGSVDLARSTADAGDDALRAAGLPPATLGARP